MGIVEIIAERRIREAIENGEFEDLPGKGKPLPRDDLQGVSSELRVSYKILKNSGILPPELELRKEMIALRDLLNACRDDGKKIEIRRKLSEKGLRYQILMEQNGQNPALLRYQANIADKLLD